MTSSTLALIASQLDRPLDSDELRCLQRLSPQGIAKINRDQCAGVSIESTLSDLKNAFQKMQQRSLSYADVMEDARGSMARPASSVGFFEHSARHFSEFSLSPSDMAMLMRSPEMKHLSQQDVDEDSLIDLALELRDNNLRASAKQAARECRSKISISVLAPTRSLGNCSSSPDITSLGSSSLCSSPVTEHPAITESFSFPQALPAINGSPKNTALPPLNQYPRCEVFATPRGGRRKIAVDPSESWFEFVTPRPQKALKPLTPKAKSDPISEKDSPSTIHRAPSKGILKTARTGSLPCEERQRRRRSNSGPLPRFGSVSVYTIPRRPRPPLALEQPGLLSKDGGVSIAKVTEKDEDSHGEDEEEKVEKVQTESKPNKMLEQTNAGNKNRSSLLSRFANAKSGFRSFFT